MRSVAASSQRHRGRSTGFSFVELLLVLCVLVSLAGIATPSLVSRFLANEQEQLLVRVLELLSEARMNSVKTGRPHGVECRDNALQVVELNSVDNSLRETRRSLTIPFDVSVQLKIPPNGNPRSKNKCLIALFYSNGTAERHVVEIRRSRYVLGLISIDRATGRMGITYPNE